MSKKAFRGVTWLLQGVVHMAHEPLHGAQVLSHSHKLGQVSRLGMAWWQVAGLLRIACSCLGMA